MSPRTTSQNETRRREGSGLRGGGTGGYANFRLDGILTLLPLDSQTGSYLLILLFHLADVTRVLSVLEISALRKLSRPTYRDFRVVNHRIIKHRKYPLMKRISSQFGYSRVKLNGNRKICSTFPTEAKHFYQQILNINSPVLYVQLL